MGIRSREQHTRRAGADIVLFHSPPGGTATAKNRYTRIDFGDNGWEWALRNDAAPPWLLLGGHVHRPRQWHDRVSVAAGHCWSLNPGCDEQAAEPWHIIIDTVAGTAEHHAGSRVAQVTLARGSREGAVRRFWSRIGRLIRGGA